NSLFHCLRTKDYLIPAHLADDAPEGIKNTCRISGKTHEYPSSAGRKRHTFICELHERPVDLRLEGLFFITFESPLFYMPCHAHNLCRIVVLVEMDDLPYRVLSGEELLRQRLVDHYHGR